MLRFYDQNPEYKIIDYRWNGQIDRLLKKNGISDKYRYQFADGRDRLDYLTGRYGAEKLHENVQKAYCAMRRLRKRIP